MTYAGVQGPQPAPTDVGNNILSISLSGAYIITASSGGAPLFSGGPVISAILRNGSGNGVMFVGGSTTGNYPSNGVGMPLYANESMTLKIKNFNMVSVVASVSGQSMPYIGVI